MKNWRDSKKSKKIYSVDEKTDYLAKNPVDCIINQLVVSLFSDPYQGQYLFLNENGVKVYFHLGIDSIDACFYKFSGLNLKDLKQKNVLLNFRISIDFNDKKHDSFCDFYIPVFLKDEEDLKNALLSFFSSRKGIVESFKDSNFYFFWNNLTIKEMLFFDYSFFPGSIKKYNVQVMGSKKKLYEIVIDERFYYFKSENIKAIFPINSKNSFYMKNYSEKNRIMSFVALIDRKMNKCF